MYKYLVCYEIYKADEKLELVSIGDRVLRVDKKVIDEETMFFLKDVLFKVLEKYYSINYDFESIVIKNLVYLGKDNF